MEVGAGATRSCTSPWSPWAQAQIPPGREDLSPVPALTLLRHHCAPSVAVSHDTYEDGGQVTDLMLFGTCTPAGAELTRSQPSSQEPRASHFTAHLPQVLPREGEGLLPPGFVF